MTGLREDYARTVTQAGVLPCRAVDPIDEAWGQVEADWGSDEAHRRFIALCAALGKLPEAGKRYRQVRADHPARSEDAARHIDTLIAMATQQLEASRVVPSSSIHKRTLTWAAFLIMLLMMAAGGWLLLRG